MHIAMAAVCLLLAKSAARNKRVVASMRDVVLFLPLWVASNYCFVAALEYAPAGLVQTLFGTAPAIVAVLSRILLVEHFSIHRAAAVALAFLGTAVISLSGWQAGNVKDRLGSGIMLGMLLALLAVFAAACYKVMFKARFGEPSVPNLLGFLGSLGLAGGIAGLPIAFLLAALGREDCWWDGSVNVNWAFVVVSAVADVAYAVSIAYGLAVSSPVYVALGVILATPVNLLVDAIVHHIRLTVTEAAGAVLIGLSFTMLSLRPACNAPGSGSEMS
mmetsp:Transcript_42854/g.71068  ORF Transcript_42854/g.71068 Transcript_42854/m.71068 type:complete len:274 (+) Transcript_42854:2-823(+)